MIRVADNGTVSPATASDGQAGPSMSLVQGMDVVWYTFPSASSNLSDNGCTVVASKLSFETSDAESSKTTSVADGLSTFSAEAEDGPVPLRDAEVARNIHSVEQILQIMIHLKFCN